MVQQIQHFGKKVLKIKIQEVFFWKRERLMKTDSFFCQPELLFEENVKEENEKLFLITCQGMQS